MKHLVIKQNITVVITFVALWLMTSCGNTKNVSTKQAETNKDSKIMFITYNISQNENGKKMIQFVSQKTVDGKIKSSHLEPVENGNQDDLICTQLDKKSKVLNAVLIKNPLKKSVEFIDESKKLQTKTIKTNKSQFSIRLQLKNKAKYITISNFVNRDPLIKTKIH